jgi:hypothetical protein
MANIVIFIYAAADRLDPFFYGFIPGGDGSENTEFP